MCLLFFSRKKSTINFLQDEKVFFVLVLFNDLVYTSTHSAFRAILALWNVVKGNSALFWNIKSGYPLISSSQPRGAIHLYFCDSVVLVASYYCVNSSLKGWFVYLCLLGQSALCFFLQCSFWHCLPQ